MPESSVFSLIHPADAARRNAVAPEDRCEKCDGTGNEMLRCYRQCSDCDGTGRAGGDLEEETSEQDAGDPVLETDPAVIAARVESIRPWVCHIARQWLHELRGRAVCFDDLVAEGLLAAVYAAQRFDTARGVQFITYASYPIRQYLRRIVARYGRATCMPEHLIASDRRRDAFERMDRNSFKFANAVMRVTSNDVELDAPVRLLYAYDGVRPSVVDMLTSDTPLADHEIEHVQAVRGVRRALESLDGPQADRDRAILTKRYFEGRTLQEIGNDLGVTRQRVEQLERAALARLREHMDAYRP